MKRFVLAYHRPTQQLLSCEETSSKDAVSRLSEVEREHSPDPEVEVVVLVARSRETLEETHARYFKSLTEVGRDFASGHTLS